jgi:hypothetical protein
MSTVRVHKDKGYFLASNQPFNDKRLSWEARGVMGYLLSKPDGWECHSYDLINQTSAGRHVIKRIISELQKAGYVHRFRKSEGRNTIKWITEVYETPELNPHLSKGQKSAIEKEGLSKAENYEVESFDDEKPVDIVITDLSNDLLTEKASSAKADYSRPISLLSEKEIKALKLPLSTWKEYLTDERAERNRKGVIKFLENKIATGPLLPDTEPAKLLFEKLAIEAEAKSRRPPGKFPTLACKEKFNKAAGRLNGTLEVAIDSGLAAGITAIPRLVNYISSPKWAEGTNERSRESATRTGQRQTYGTAGQPTKDPFAPAPGSGQTPEMEAKLRAIFARD